MTEIHHFSITDTTALREGRKDTKRIKDGKRGGRVKTQK
jgi:hypothetical protein